MTNQIIYEKIDLKIDLAALQAHCLDVQQKVEPCWQVNPRDPNLLFGGWALQSWSGKHKDSWAIGPVRIKTDANGKKYLDRSAFSEGWHPNHEHTQNTEACYGYAEELLAAIRELGLEPVRTRYTILGPGKATAWHLDDLPDTYSVRLHIPVFTNENCFFEIEGKKEHAPAGSAYLVAVNRLHRAYNYGATDRVHWITDIRDLKGISVHHRA